MIKIQFIFLKIDVYEFSAEGNGLCIMQKGRTSIYQYANKLAGFQALKRPDFITAVMITLL